MIVKILTLICLCGSLWAGPRSVVKVTQNDFFNIVSENRKIVIPGYPDAHNPSIIDTDEGILLIFRTLPNQKKLWVSHLGVVYLNEELEVISEPQLISMRPPGYSKVVSQAEDARLFASGGKLYLIYNDNIDVERPTISGRRDMFVAELIKNNGVFSIGRPVKHIHEEKYEKMNWQKNWSPFEYNNQMHLSYSMNPHEVLTSDEEGVSTPLFRTDFHAAWWKYGPIRGGTPSMLVDGKYLGFFHSSCYARNIFVGSSPVYHYFMGAYMFEAQPPFTVTHITPHPIWGEHFYTPSDYPKKVVFPGGFIVREETIYVALGIDDSQLWICSIPKKELLKCLYDVHPKSS